MSMKLGAGKWIVSRLALYSLYSANRLPFFHRLPGFSEKGEGPKWALN